MTISFFYTAPRMEGSLQIDESDRGHLSQGFISK